MSYTIKLRGARSMVLADYECPVHGMFEVLVERDEQGDPPASTACLEGEGCGDAQYRLSAVLGRVRFFEAVRKGGWEKPERKDV